MWLFLGWLFVALGIVGAALPLMPTVPFLLMAAFCFERGSPRLHAWLIHHPKFGPPLVEWQKHRVIRWQGKLLSVGGLSLSGTYTVFFSDRPLGIKVAVAVMVVAVSIFILTRRSQP
jgi:uncharacterized membrane protein YbaN (DUF454 family)